MPGERDYTVRREQRIADLQRRLAEAERKNQQLDDLVTYSRELYLQSAQNSADRIVELEKRLSEQRALLRQALEALHQIASARPTWSIGVGSYVGGETWCAFANRLQEVASALLASPEARKAMER
jgi:predicted component of type VI protein secretion system